MSTSNDLLSSTSGSFNSIDRAQFSNYLSANYLSDCLGNLGARTVKFFQENDSLLPTAAFITTNCLLIYLMRKVAQASITALSSRFSALQNHDGAPRRILNGVTSLGTGAATYFFNTAFSQFVNYNMHHTLNVICSFVTVIYIFKNVNDRPSNASSTIPPQIDNNAGKNQSANFKGQDHDEKEEKTGSSLPLLQKTSSSSSTTPLNGNDSEHGEGYIDNEHEEKTGNPSSSIIILSTPPSSTGTGSISLNPPNKGIPLSTPVSIRTAVTKTPVKQLPADDGTILPTPESQRVLPNVNFFNALDEDEKKKVLKDQSTPDRQEGRRSLIITESPVKLS